MNIKTCPICGKEFPCYADEDRRICWCESFPKIEIKDALDCLCPDCLANKALGQGYSQNEIPKIDSEKIVIIKVEEIKGSCPIFHKNDRIVIKNAIIDLQNTDAVCIHAIHSLVHFALALREGADPEKLGLTTEGDKAYVQCPDPGPPYTLGGTVVFSIKRI